MMIENLIKKINDELKEHEKYGTPSPAANEEIIQFKQEISEQLNYTIPLAYEKLLSYSNGIMFNGLVIWPTKKHWLFQESFLSANFNLRETINETFVYFGNRDEELYIYNPNTDTDTYQGIEYIADMPWVEFDTPDAMFEFLINRVLEE